MKVRCDLEKFWLVSFRHRSSEKLKVRSSSPAGEGGWCGLEGMQILVNSLSCRVHFNHRENMDNKLKQIRKIQAANKT
jgi:hypothetical protein